MSLTKRAIDQANEAEQRQLAKEQETCGCKYNWDDKFWQLCETHQAHWGDDNFYEDYVDIQE